MPDKRREMIEEILKDLGIKTSLNNLYINYTNGKTNKKIVEYNAQRGKAHVGNPWSLVMPNEVELNNEYFGEGGEGKTYDKWLERVDECAIGEVVENYVMNILEKVLKKRLFAEWDKEKTIEKKEEPSLEEILGEHYCSGGRH
jgi:hypothetical protein